MSEAAQLPVANSYAALIRTSPLSRQPRPTWRKRDQAFRDAFDTKTLFYDCFWHADGKRVLLVGPPPNGMQAFHELAEFTAQPSGMRLKSKLHRSLSVMLTELPDVPAGTTHLTVTFAAQKFDLPVQPNSSATLAGRRLLFSINRDNDLAWIREWALFHTKVHGTDAVILFDNNSTRYATAEIEATLRSVPGLAFVGVPYWPYSFGPIDKAVRTNPFWSRFLQIASMSVVLRRYGAEAAGLLNCDIDELAGTRSGQSIYALANESRSGLVAFRGQWVEAVRSSHTGAHRDFQQRLTDPRRARSRPRKWALDPRHAWVNKLSVHPYWHWIEGRPLFGRATPEDALYWHFRGINTNWKQQRNRPPKADSELQTHRLLAERFRMLDAP